MADIEGQDRVCAFVRNIIATRIGEVISISGRPESTHRNIPVVEELWTSSSHSYAIEHTRVESFEGQIANIKTIERLLVPVKDMLADRVPGRFVLAVREKETSAVRMKPALVHAEVVRLVLETAPLLNVEETRTLHSDRLTFDVQLHLRQRDDSSVVIYTDIEGDPEALRLDRFRRALAAKCPKLADWAREGRTSVLALESNDIQHSNFSVNYVAFERAIAERNDQPDIVVLVETEVSPMYGWMFKEGERFGDDVSMPHGQHCYVEGEFNSL